MKDIFRFVALVATVALLAIHPPAAAQSCGAIYVYQDLWVDESSNLVGENYTDADASCGEYSTYATVTVVLPSGSSTSGSATSLSSFAEALAAAPASSQSGSGELDGFSRVDYVCGSSIFDSFSTPFTAYGCYCERINIEPITNQCLANCECTDASPITTVTFNMYGPYGLKKPPCNMQISCPRIIEAVKVDIIFANIYAASACHY